MLVTKSKPPRFRKKRTVVYFQRLNDVLENRNFDASVAEEEINNLTDGACIFSKLVLAKGYLQLKLTEKAQSLVVVATSSGWYKFKFMPLGLKPAVAEFQTRIENLIGTDGRAFIKIYIDDIKKSYRMFSQNSKLLISSFEEINVNLEKLKLNFWVIELIQMECFWIKNELKQFFCYQNRRISLN